MVNLEFSLTKEVEALRAKVSELGITCTPYVFTNGTAVIVEIPLEPLGAWNDLEEE